MGLNLTAAPVVPAVAEQKPFDIMAETQKMRAELATSEEVDKLLSTVNIHDINSVEAYGNDAAMAMGKAADVAMQDMNRAMLFEDQTSGLMGELRKIMASVDISEINKKPGFLQNIKKKVEKLLAKYQSISVDIDKIYVKLAEYEEEAKKANTKLDLLFDGNVATFKEVQKYIVAGEQGCQQIQEAIDEKAKEFQEKGDPAIKFELDNLTNALTIFERKVASLRTAESYALQNIPMIKIQQMTNVNLIAKIHEDFIITLPAFKQGIVNAVLLKRQKLQSEALAELDKQTNEMLKRNAVTTVEVAKNSARLVSTSSIDVSTLEDTWKTISNGIDEVSKIYVDAKKKREEDKLKLEAIKQQFFDKFGAPNK